MESCAEYDDDVHYADLERQILTLMVDDEDDSNMASATASPPPLLHQQMASNVGSPTNLVWYSPPTIIEDWSRPYHVHSWKLPNRENSAGTGVFIPQTQKKAKEGKRGKGVHACRNIGYRHGSRKDK